MPAVTNWRDSGHRNQQSTDHPILTHLRSHSMNHEPQTSLTDFHPSQSQRRIHLRPAVAMAAFPVCGGDYRSRCRPSPQRAVTLPSTSHSPPAQHAHEAAEGTGQSCSHLGALAWYFRVSMSLFMSHSETIHSHTRGKLLLPVKPPETCIPRFRSAPSGSLLLFLHLRLA